MTRLSPEREAEIRYLYASSPKYKWLSIEIGALLAEIDALRHALKIEELKNRNSLARNLCPDHRDKQYGKPYLACEIERLTKG